MAFEEIKKFNTDNNQDILEKETLEIPEEQEEDVVNQDPDYGVLSQDKASQKRKDLSKLIKEHSRIRKEIILNRDNKEKNIDKEKRIQEIKEKLNKDFNG